MHLSGYLEIYNINIHTTTASGPDSLVRTSTSPKSLPKDICSCQRHMTYRYGKGDSIDNRELWK